MGLLDIFGGGDGTSSTDALYAGLLTPEQIAAVKREQAQKGLLAMAAAFGQAGMPSRLPVPTGAVLGQVAGAMGQVDDTGAIAKFLTAQKLAAETQTLKAKQEWIKRANDPNDPLSKLIDRYYGGAGTPGGTVPPPAGTPVDANGKPLASIPSAAGSPRGGINPAEPFGKPGTPIPLVPVDPATVPPALRGGMPGITPEGEDPDTQGGIVRPINPASAAPPGRGAAAAPAVPFPTRVSGPAVPAPTWAGQPDTMISDLAMNRTPPRGAVIPPLPAGGVMPPPRAGSFTPPAGTEPYTSSTQMAGFRTPQQFRQDIPLADPDVGEQAAAVQAPDVVIPSGARPALPVIRTQAQLPAGLANPNASPLGAPPAAAGAPRAGGIPAVPATPGGPIQAPPPPPGDQAGMGAILRELARRNATAEMLGLGSPYSGLISILQNSPQAKALEEYQRRSIGLGFAGPERAAQEAAAFPYTMTAAQYQSQLRSYENQVKALGDAALAPAEIRIATGRIGPDGKPETTTIQGTQLQAARAANGFAVPELGIPGIDINTGVNTRAGGGALNPAYGTPAGKPGEPSELEKGAQKGFVEDARAAIKDTHAEEMAANRRAPLYAQLTSAMENFRTGRTAEYRLAIGQVYQDLTGKKVEGVAEGEVLQSIFARLQSQMAPKGQGSVSNFERELYGRIPGSIINSPEALHQMIAIGLQLDAYDRRVAQAWRGSIRNGIPDYTAGLDAVSRLGPALTADQLNMLQRYATLATPGTGAAPAPGQPGVVQTPRGPVTVE